MFIFNLYQFNRINDDVYYHEIGHYILTLNCIREGDVYPVVSLNLRSTSHTIPSDLGREIKLYHEGFAEFVSRYLTGNIETEKFIPSNTDRNTFVMYEKGFEKIKRLFITLRDPKKVLEEVTETILKYVRSF